MRFLLAALCVLVVGAGPDSDLAHAGKTKKVDWSQYLEDPSDRKPLVQTSAKADKGDKATKAGKASKADKSKRARKAKGRAKRGKR